MSNSVATCSDPETWKLFLGLPLPGEAAGILQALRPALPELRGVLQWERPDDFHLTLRFLGAVPVAELAQLSQVLTQALTGWAPLRLTVAGAGHFRHRVIWTGVACDLVRLESLARGVAVATAEFGQPPGSRPFVPHVTLARAKSRRGLNPRERLVLDEVLPRFAAREWLHWEASSVVLFRTQPQPDGTRYLPVERFPLAG